LLHRLLHKTQARGVLGAVVKTKWTCCRSDDRGKSRGRPNSRAGVYQILECRKARIFAAHEV